MEPTVKASDKLYIQRQHVDFFPKLILNAQMCHMVVVIEK
jgi:hypothetical protein